MSAPSKCATLKAYSHHRHHHFLQRFDTALERCLDNDMRRLLSEAMGVPYQPLEGHELKNRREALEAERKARFMPNFDDIPDATGSDGVTTNGGRVDMIAGPHSPGIVMPGPGSMSTVLEVRLDIIVVYPIPV